jgi:hypothetical protein
MISNFDKVFGMPVCWDDKSQADVIYLGFMDNTVKNSLEFATDSTDFKSLEQFMILKIAADPNDANVTVASAPDGQIKFSSAFSDRLSLTYKPILY